mmetsp:Transcript_21916/g.50513  ORF Transcript_21916/g.50513 Transcript_21916/m.50513 type:complete len:126 (+) Transcript_21916:52-429(+)
MATRHVLATLVARPAPAASTVLRAQYHAAPAVMGTWGKVPRPRHELPKITLQELRKAYRQKKRRQPPCQKEFLNLLDALGANNDDHQAPGVQRANLELDSALKNFNKESNKSYTLYQLAKYVRRH